MFRLTTRPRTADEEDFVLKTVNVTFEPGQSGPKRVNFDIIDDKIVEDTESFSVVLASSVSAVIANTSATVNIQDNDGNFSCKEKFLLQITRLLSSYTMLHGF